MKKRRARGVAVFAGVIAVAALAGCMTAAHRECTCRCGRCACCEAEPVCTDEELAEGFMPLFDGKTMANWVVPESGCYRVAAGGVMEYRPDLGGGGLWTEREYGDFCLRFDFRLTSDCNNGLAVRCPKDNLNTYTGGFEVQIIDDESTAISEVLPQLGLRQQAYQRHGAVYGVVPPRVREDGRSFLNPVGRWNRQEVWMKGSRLKVVLNGSVIQDVDLDACPTEGLDHAAHPGIRSRRGCLGWLSHGYPCFWKRIRIREL